MAQVELGKQQLEVLRHISDHAPATVAEVAAHFQSTQGLARTTILTVMEKLRLKGYLAREKNGSVYEYAPRVSKAQLMRNVVGSFVEQTLEGSYAPFLAYLAHDKAISDEELEQLKWLVHDLEAQREATGASPAADDTGPQPRPRQRR